IVSVTASSAAVIVGRAVSGLNSAGFFCGCFIVSANYERPDWTAGCVDAGNGTRGGWRVDLGPWMAMVFLDQLTHWRNCCSIGSTRLFYPRTYRSVERKDIARALGIVRLGGPWLMDSLHCLLYAHPSVRRNAVWMDEWINGGSFSRNVCDMAMARWRECFETCPNHVTTKHDGWVSLHDFQCRSRVPTSTFYKRVISLFLSIPT
ncbi:major facilitator superfamily transporter, partial [Penicillium sp. CMV-2018d]